jgi:hypothetical protein
MSAYQIPDHGLSTLLILIIFDVKTAEVVLSTLLQTFRFSPSDRKVVWEWNGTVQPTTEDAEIMPNGTRKLQLPLKVSLV